MPPAPPDSAVVDSRRQKSAIYMDTVHPASSFWVLGPQDFKVYANEYTPDVVITGIAVLGLQSSGRLDVLGLA